jgi:outer membrane lipoprotein-sorting protein
MRRLRTISTRRILTVLGLAAVLVAGAGIAQAALGGGAKPAPKPLAVAVRDALAAPQVPGVSARITFTNGLLPSGSLPEGSASALMTGAKGRLWATAGGGFRLELQSDAGDAQITSDGTRVVAYDSSSNTAYVADLPKDKGTAAGDTHKAPTLADVQKGLADLGKAWDVSGAQPGTTGGQGSYTVHLAPKDDGGLLGAAELAWDAQRGVPLRAAVYAQGQATPVLQLEATDISYGSVPASRVKPVAPAGAKVVDLAPKGAPDRKGRPTQVTGAKAVGSRLGFPLAAPAKLAGLPRKQVRLVDAEGTPGALTVYGRGLGAIAVFQRKAGAAKPAPAKGGRDQIKLPQINIAGATGTELATALGTVVSFDRAGISYTVAGSVPPAAAENAARDLR